MGQFTSMRISDELRGVDDENARPADRHRRKVSGTIPLKPTPEPRNQAVHYGLGGTPA
jgi:hypothetical protein